MASVAEYSLQLKRSAEKELNNLSDTLFARIDSKIILLSGDPKPAGCVKLAGHKDTWRIRVGNYRVVYTVDEARKVVCITRVAHRKEVYEP